jgi:aromatic ring-opening dioxygenase LigB subunit
MRTAAQILVDSKPDVLVLLSPHTPRARRAWAIYEGEHLNGDMARFGASQVNVQLPIANTAIRIIHEEAADKGIETFRAPTQDLDHGAAVPLIFVHRAGWRGPTVLIALPWEQLGQEERMGEVLAAAATSNDQRWAILASGDMSHKLKPGAPAGFDPEAHLFDQAFVDLVSAGDYQGLRQLDPDLRKNAAEDCVQTTIIAASATGWSTHGAKFLSYEGPFGVGYSEAVLFNTTEVP